MKDFLKNDASSPEELEELIPFDEKVLEEPVNSKKRPRGKMNETIYRWNPLTDLEMKEIETVAKKYKRFQLDKVLSGLEVMTLSPEKDMEDNESQSKVTQTPF